MSTGTADAREKRDGYHHGDLRQALLDATRELVEELGPEGFSVSEACRRAGVSTAAPYRHFKDRGELLRGVALQGMARMEAILRATLAGYPSGTIESIAAIGQDYLAFAEAEPQVFRMMFAADAGEGDEVKEAGISCYGIVLNEVRALLGKPDIDEEVQRRTFPLWAFVHGVAFLQIDGKMDVSKVQDDVPGVITEATRRLLA